MICKLKKKQTNSNTVFNSQEIRMQYIKGKKKKKKIGRGEVGEEQKIRLTNFNCNRNEGKTNHTFLSCLPSEKGVLLHFPSFPIFISV